MTFAVSRAQLRSQLRGAGLDHVEVVTLDVTLDLQVANLHATPSSGVQSGGTFLVQWNDANAGNLDSAGSFTDSLTVITLRHQVQSTRSRSCAAT